MKLPILSYARIFKSHQLQELADLATKATDQAEESEAKVKTCIAEKEAQWQKFSDEKQELLAKLMQLEEVINDKHQQLKVRKPLSPSSLRL